VKKLKRWLRKFLGSPGSRKALAGLTLATCLLVATSAAASGGGVMQLEDINWFGWDSHKPPVGWFILDFAFFALLLVWYGKRPVREAFAQRHVQVKRALEEAAKAFAAAEGLYEEYKSKLANVEDEASQFVDSGRKDGALERDQIVETAKNYAERLRKDSSAVMQQELDKAQARLRREVVHEVLKLTEQNLRSELTDGDRNRLIEDAINELENGDSVAKATSRGESSERPRAGGAA
jgi:F-type H+-transporting ATPase subunit b